MEHKTLIYMFLLGSLILFGCTKKTDKNSPDKKLTATELTDSDMNNYPHSIQFVKKNHADIYVRNPKNCKVCHNEFMTQKMILPHTPVFKDTWVHGRRYLDEKVRVKSGVISDFSCQKCHGPVMEENFCLQCHKQYPHPKNFMDKHGIAFLEGRHECQGCHQQQENEKSFRSKNLAHHRKNCQDCHRYPHPPGWSRPKGGHTQIFYDDGIGDMAQTFRSECESCHVKNSNLFNIGKKHFVACNDCHTLMPHAGGGRRGTHTSKVPGVDFQANDLKGHCGDCHLTRDLETIEVEEGRVNCADCHRGSLLKMHWKESDFMFPVKLNPQSSIKKQKKPGRSTASEKK